MRQSPLHGVEKGVALPYRPLWVCEERSGCVRLLPRLIKLAEAEIKGRERPVQAGIRRRLVGLVRPHVRPRPVGPE